MPRENEDVVRLWFEGFNENGMPALEVCDERLEIGNVEGFPIQGPYHGHEGVREWTRDLFEVLDEARLEVIEVIEAGVGETVMSVQRIVARMRHTRLPAKLRWAGVWTIHDGKAVRVQGYATRREALVAAGLGE